MTASSNTPKHALYTSLFLGIQDIFEKPIEEVEIDLKHQKIEFAFIHEQLLTCLRRHYEAEQLPKGSTLSIGDRTFDLRPQNDAPNSFEIFNLRSDRLENLFLRKPARLSISDANDRSILSFNTQDMVDYRSEGYANEPLRAATDSRSARESRDTALMFSYEDERLAVDIIGLRDASTVLKIYKKS